MGFREDSRAIIKGKIIYKTKISDNHVILQIKTQTGRYANYPSINFFDDLAKEADAFSEGEDVAIYGYVSSFYKKKANKRSQSIIAESISALSFDNLNPEDYENNVIIRGTVYENDVTVKGTVTLTKQISDTVSTALVDIEDEDNRRHTLLLTGYNEYATKLSEFAGKKVIASCYMQSTRTNGITRYALVVRNMKEREL